MHVLITNLHKTRPTLVQQLVGEDQAVAEVRQIGVNAQFPGVAEGFERLRLARQILILAVLDVALVDEGLEVGAVLDAGGRVDVDHLHLAGHGFLFEQ